ncbi:hypothetical protein IQ07DRAFT_318981 [Pyrenochaeta sp. DS3sAY3a]|nr:hypothetical protein IQ07DRAFT_318981 [Pyrenochaeta sp. DS3sAY3a]
MARTKPRPNPKPVPLHPLPPDTEAVVRSGPEAVVYHIPVSPTSSESTILKTTIALPRHSRWTSGLHFHATHTEYLRLLKGSIFVELYGELHILSAQAGGTVSVRTGELLERGLVVKVEQYARHNWGRAKEYMHRPGRFGFHTRVEYPKDSEDEVVVEEWTDPADISKPLFFWNLNGVINASTDASVSTTQKIARKLLGNFWIPFQFFIIFWELDNWPVFVRLHGLMPPKMGDFGAYIEHLAEYAMTWVVLLIAKSFGSILGVHAVAQERTPPDLWENFKRSRL